MCEDSHTYEDSSANGDPNQSEGLGLRTDHGLRSMVEMEEAEEPGGMSLKYTCIQNMEFHQGSRLLV